MDIEDNTITLGGIDGSNEVNNMMNCFVRRTRKKVRIKCITYVLQEL